MNGPHSFRLDDYAFSFPESLIAAAPPADAASFEQMRLIDVEGALVKKAMLRFKGNVSRAAKALGLSRSALYRRLQRHGV